MSASQEIREALDDPLVRGLPRIQIVMATGLLAFAGFVVWRGSRPAAADATDIGTSGGLYPMLGVAAIVAFLAGLALGNALLRQRLSRAAGGSAIARVEALKSGIVLRLSLMEFPALAGCALGFMATQHGPPASSLAWLSLAPALLFAAFCFTTLPSRDRLEELLREG